MMLSKTTALLGVLCAAASEYVASASVPAVYPHVPLVFWSDRAMFNTNDAYLNSVFDENEVAFVLHNVVTRDTDKDFYNVLNHEPVTLIRSEALCVFVRKNLRSEQLADFGKSSFVQKAVKTSTSSVVIPHTTRSQSLTHALADVNAPVISIEDMESWIASAEGKKLLNNDETDLVVVQIPDHFTLPEADFQIQKAVEAMQKATQGLTDFALTGDEALPVVVKTPSTGGRRLAAGASISAGDIICDAEYLIGMSASGKAFCFSHYVRMTPEILTALLFGFFFLFLAYVGISVLHAIQTPLRYPHHGPPKGKEF